MAECLYYGDKPIGLIQSNAEDVEYSSGVSVKDKIDDIGTKITTQNVDISSVTWKTSINSNYTWFRRKGDVVYFQIFVTGAIAGETAIAENLPTSIRPSLQQWFTASQSNGGSLTSRIIINSNGTMNALLIGNSGSNFFANGSYTL